MPREEQGTYFLYGRGYKPEQLRLGHLVLETYENPRNRQFQAYRSLTDVELRDVADVTPYSGKLTVTKKGNMGLDLLVLGGGEIGPKYATEATRVISADKGSRIELKDPQEFIQRVLSDANIQATLQRWTSVSRSKYLRARTGLSRAPKIWVLTGLLELEDGTSSVVKSSDRGLELGVDPELLTALCGAPIGFSIDLGRSRSAEVEAKLDGKMVWAARFQLLQTIYKTWKGNTTLEKNQFQLHPDGIFAGDLVLGDDDEDEEEDVEEEEQIAELTLLPAGSDSSDDGELSVSFWEAYEEAERRMFKEESGIDVV